MKKDNTTKKDSTNKTETTTATETKKNLRETQKTTNGTRVDAWLKAYKEKIEADGGTVEIKTWEKNPTERSLKVNGVVYFAMYFSSNGLRLCSRSTLIPEAVRDEGWYIVKNGQDLCIPTFADIEGGLKKYTDACTKSVEAAKAKKAAEKKAKEEAAKKAKKEKASKKAEKAA